MRKSKRMFAVVMTLVLSLAMMMGSMNVFAAKAVKPSKIVLKSTTANLYVGDTATVTVKSVKPAKAVKTVTFASSDDAVATVTAEGVVTGVKAGTAKITATSTAAKKVKATYTIKVKDMPALNIITPETLKADASKYVIVDLRKVVDYQTGHIAGAVSADVADYSLETPGPSAYVKSAVANLKKVVKKDAQYALICYSGNAYAKAGVKALANLGVDPAKIFVLGDATGKQSKDGGMNGWRAAGYETVPSPVVDKKAKSVSITCTVRENVVNASADGTRPAHWFVVSKNGSMADKAILNTAVTTDDFYAAMKEVAGNKMWNKDSSNTKLVKTFGVADSINSQLKKKVGNKNFAKFAVTVTVGDKTYALKDVLTNVSYNGKAYKGTYKVGFNGNLGNQHIAGTGCITCFGGCYMGITSGFDTPMMIEFTPANLPAAGETVTVTYTLK